MYTIYKTLIGNELTQIEKIEPGCWINMINPTEKEIDFISLAVSIDKDDMASVLDAEESSRLEIGEHYNLIIVDCPMVVKKNRADVYKTLPIAIFKTENLFVTVCLKENDITNHFIKEKVKTFNTTNTIKSILQILFKNASLFIHYLYLIDKQSDMIEERINRHSKNQELIKLLYLEKSLIFFSNSLNSNQSVYEKLHRLENNHRTHEEEEILEDLIIENKQALEMTKTYSEILSGIMDFFSSLISNNLNVVMKTLTSITLILYIPTLISSLFGMNVPLPLMHTNWALPILLLISFSISVLVALYMKWKDLL